MSTVFPTGTVTVFVDGQQVATLTLSSGGENSSAVFNTSTLTAGSHTITTTYAGDANFNGSTGSVTQQVKVPAAVNSSLTVSATPTSSVFGQSVTFTVTILSATGTGTPTGTVTFSDGISQVGSATAMAGPGTGESTATLTTSALPVSRFAITASYSGDSTFNPSTISTPFTVAKANTNTGLTSSQNPSSIGQSVTFTVTVTAAAPGSGIPTGTVTFADTTTLTTLGSGQLSGGVATITTSVLAVGSHNITATYNGDGNFNGSSGTLTQTVNKATPATTGLRAIGSPGSMSAAPIFIAAPSATILKANKSMRWRG